MYRTLIFTSNTSKNKINKIKKIAKRYPVKVTTSEGYSLTLDFGSADHRGAFLYDCETELGFIDYIKWEV